MWVVTRKPCGSRSTSQSRLVSAMASAETSHIATLQPSATSWRASSRPIPVPPPVMTAVFPAKSFMETLILFLPRVFAMGGLVPPILLRRQCKDVDARHKAGHDDPLD